MRLIVSLLLALGIMLGIAAAAAAQRLDPLPAEQVFRFYAQIDGNAVVAEYQLPNGIYLYRDKLLLTTTTPAVTVSPPPLPPAMLHEDEFFGRVSVYYGGVTLRAAVSGNGAFTLVALSQGCDEQVGICYPPQQHTAVLTVAAAATTDSGTATNAPANAASAAAAALADGNFFYIILLFFLLGVGLSLTPCVLPMLPILAGIIGGGEKTKKQVVALTAAYIAGVVAAFTAAGVAAAYAGQLLSAFLQKPPVLIITALLLVALALSLFGVYSLRLPSLHRRQQQDGGGFGGAFLMGAAAALIVSPCVSAPLIGALLYISQTGDVAVGAFALMALALGMSVLLAAAGVAGGNILPKAGEWTNGVQRFFGWLLLLVAVWTAAPALPTAAVMVLYGVLLLFGGMMTRPLALEKNAAIALFAIKAAGLTAVLWGALLLAGAAGGGRDPLKPLSFLSAQTAAEAATPLDFRPLRTVTEYDAIAAATERPIMLEFYADWCVTCKEMEYFTFTDERVRTRLQKALLLRADVTDNTAEQQALLRHFNVFGPPAMLFYRSNGTPSGRVDGYQNADDFLKTMIAAGL